MQIIAKAFSSDYVYSLVCRDIVMCPYLHHVKFSGSYNFQLIYKSCCDKFFLVTYIDGLVQERCNSSAPATPDQLAGAHLYLDIA